MAPSNGVYWDSDTVHLLPRLLRLPDGSTRTHGPLFLSERCPAPLADQRPRTAMRYVIPGADSIAKVTKVLAPRRRTH